MFSFIRESIASKISLVIICLVMGTASFVGTIFYYGGSKVMVAREFEGIHAKGELVKELLESKLNSFTEDILFLSKIQSTKNLEEIKYSLQVKKHILDIARYEIDGKRVSGYGLGSEILPERMNLLSYDLKGVHLGKIRLVRENNIIVRPFVPYMTIITPLFDERKKKIGHLVIAAELGFFFSQLEQMTGKDIGLYLYNKDGDLLFHHNKYRRFGFEQGIRYRIQDEFPELKKIQFVEKTNALNLSRLFDSKGEVVLIHSRKLILNGSKDQFIGILLSTPRSKILAIVKQIRNQSFILTFILILVTAIIGWLVTRYLMRNLNDITAVAKRYSQGEMDLSVEVKSNDEIGTLALTFQGMIRQVNERTRILKKSERRIREARDQAEQALSAKSQLLEDIREQKEEIERVSKDKDDLLAIVSHDLKNPLSVIETSMDILMEDKNIKPDGMSYDLIRRSKNSAKMALNLITDLLDLARLEGGIKLDYEKFSVTELVANVLDSFYLKSSDKEININKDIEGEPFIYADYGRVIQVFSNIVGNALKFLPRHGTLNVIIKVIEGKRSIDGSSQCLEVIIKDNGPGIPEGKIGQIFNKFEQAREKDREIGTGLGLAICKNICQLHQGDIWAESREGEGASFTIILPRIVVAEEASVAIVDQIQKTLLIVDDNEEVRKNFKQNLSEEDYFVLESKNGEEALNTLESQKVDIILLDLEMPVKDGFETLKDLRVMDDYKNIPVFAMTDNLEVNNFKVIGLGADDLIQKNIAIDELDEKIKSILHSQFSRNFIKQLNEDCKTVLIVDDEEDIRELIADTLMEEKLNVLKAKSGIEALFLFNKYKTDIVISDIRMQEMDGLTLTRILKKDHAEVPIILISGNIVSLPEDLDKKLGVCKLFQKPFAMEDLVAEIKSVLDIESLKESNAESVEKNEEESRKELHVEKSIMRNLKKENIPVKTLKILLVEDSEDMQMLFKVLMRSESCEITIVENGKIACDKFQYESWDVIFMDINMPVMKGDEAILIMREIEKREKREETKIVVMSANDAQEDIDKYIGIGFNSFLKKPLNKAKIKDELEDLAA